MNVSRCLQSTSIIYTAWYVVFYIQAIVMALICFRINKLLAECIFLLPIPVLIEYVNPGNMFSHYFPVFMLGYIFSKYRLYEKWENLYKKKFSKICNKYISIINGVYIKVSCRRFDRPSFSDYTNRTNNNLCACIFCKNLYKDKID